MAILGSVLVAQSAAASSITGGGIDQARACTTVSCSLGTETFQLAAAGDVSGSIVLDTAASTLDFAFTAPSFALDEATGGSDDNGVASIAFSSVTYSGSVGVFEPTPGTWIVNPASVASVAGGQVQLDNSSAQVNPGAPDFSAPVARLSGSCFIAGGALTCGLIFGTADFAFDIGETPASRYFQHTADVVALPEPTTLAMLGIGLALAALGGRPE